MDKHLIYGMVIWAFLGVVIIGLSSYSLGYDNGSFRGEQLCEQSTISRIEHKLDGVMPVLEHHKAQQEFIMRGED